MQSEESQPEPLSTIAQLAPLVSNLHFPIYTQPHIPRSSIQKLLKCTKFNEYLQAIKNAGQRLQIERLTIKYIIEFRKGNIGFVVLKIKGKWNGKQFRQYSDYVFMQGKSVTLLIFVNQKILVTQQYRVPKQEMCLEAPAGMMDEQKNLHCQAITQLQEQTGINIKADQLIALGSVRPNPEISDQHLYLYFGEIKLSKEEMKQAESRIYGQRDSGQNIKIKFMDYNPEQILKTGNCAFIMLCIFYENYVKQKQKEKKNQQIKEKDELEGDQNK